MGLGLGLRPGLRLGLGLGLGLGLRLGSRSTPAQGLGPGLGPHLRSGRLPWRRRGLRILEPPLHVDPLRGRRRTVSILGGEEGVDMPALTIRYGYARLTSDTSAGFGFGFGLGIGLGLGLGLGLTSDMSAMRRVAKAPVSLIS